MELNKIIRRTGVPHSAVYTKLVADLTDATKDINGMTKEDVKEVKDTDGTIKEKASILMAAATVRHTPLTTLLRLHTALCSRQSLV